MAEAIGIVLGVASLVFSAVENYHSTTNFFRTVRHYPRRLKAALQVLETQELCFRKANERLLSSIVDEDQARQMLVNPAHAAWHDADVAQKYSELLGESARGFECAVGLVSDELDVIRNEFRKFEIPENEPAKVVRKKLRFAFNQSIIEESLRALREKTQDVVALTNLTSSQVPVRNEAVSTSSSLKKDLSQFLKVKQTAEDLHLALGSACTVHTDHQAHLSLEPGYSDTDQIRFTLAFSQLSLRDSAPAATNSSQSTWLTVESTITGTIQSVQDADSCLSGLRRSLKRTSDDAKSDDTKPKSRQIRKCLRFQDEPASCPQIRTIPKSLQDPLINLCKKGNFCHQLSKFINQSRPTSQAVGSFEISHGSKHLIYIDSKYQRVQESSAKPKLKPLSQMMREMNGDDTAVGIALYHKTRLAKQLARAVLHFHTTAWLQETWNIKQILVSPTYSKGDESDTDLEAYVTSQIHGPHNSQPSPSLTPNPLVVRNGLLFRLGIMLLELAYQKSLSELTTPADEVGVSPGDIPYCTANRLSGKVSALVGPRYAEVVRKCIHCDFGRGFDLKQSKLQEAFYQTVVCELDKLEKML